MTIVRSSRDLRVGVVGTGFIGSVHARAIRAAGAQIVAVAASTAQGAAMAAKRLQAEHYCASADELIGRSDVDIVHICTPNAQHVAAAETALREGKHVVCEKPLAMELSDARRVAAVARHAGLVATVPFIYRFYPMVREIRERVRRGGPAKLSLLHGSYLQDWLADKKDCSWRVDTTLGGRSRAFADIGVHWCDILEFTTEHRITRLTARLITSIAERGAGASRIEIRNEDIALVMFETDRGACGHVVVSQISVGRKNRLWFSWDGIDSSYSFDQEEPNSLWLGGRMENRVLLGGPGALSESAQRYASLPPGHPQGFQDCFNAFVADTYAAVVGECPEGLPTFEDGCRAAALTEAVIESAASQTWVEVPT